MPTYNKALRDEGAAAANRNSTTSFNGRDAATLAASATFQGVGEDVSAYGRVGISVRSTNSADGVLTIEVSHDNVLWGGPTRSWADTSRSAPHMWNIVEQYFRIKYVNGTTEALNLSIQVQYSNNADILLGHQLTETLQTEVEAIITRPGSEFDLDAARRQIDGKRAFFFFGYNGAVGTSYEDIWPVGGNINWLTSPTKVEVLSTHAADTATGLGVQSVEVHGLSAAGEDQDEIIAMGGTGPIESALTYIRVNKMHSEECGTYGGSHQGDITCRVTGAGSTQSMMTGFEGAVDSSVQYGSGEAGNGFWSVPLGKVLYITRVEVTPNFGASNKTIDAVLYERENLLDVTTPFAPRRIIWGEFGVEGGVIHEFKSHIKIKALTDLWFRVLGSAESKVDVVLDFYLVDANAAGA